MAKNKVSEWSATPADNTDVGGIDINEGCAPSGINNAIRDVMAQIKDMQTGADGDNFAVSGTLALTGGLTLDGSAGTSGQVMVSAGSGNTPTWGNAFVAGMIMLWSGSSATIPSGWLLCDGSNSTPDLRNRFVVGATSTYAVGATGGSANAIVVSHTHTATTDSAGAHAHNINQFSGSSDTPWVETAYLCARTGGTNTGKSVTDRENTVSIVSNGAHTHTLTTDSAGSSGTNANLPPYYALCYIMKS
jgi:hypothetical protein